MDIFAVTHEEHFRATHEIGHVLIAEKLGVDWSQVTIDHPDENFGGVLDHSDPEETKENLEKIVLLKMAGEAICIQYYDEMNAMASAKNDREEVAKTIARIEKRIEEYQIKLCCRRAARVNIMYFRKPAIRDTIPRLVDELLKRRTMTREEFLQFQGQLNCENS